MTLDEVLKLTGLSAPSSVRVPSTVTNPNPGWQAFDPNMDLPDGTQFQFRSPQGIYEFTLNGSDWAPSGVPKAASRTKTGYPSADDVAKDPLAAAKAQYDAVRTDPAATPADVSAAYNALRSEQDKADKAAATASGKAADTQANAAVAQAKLAKGETPTAAELSAYVKTNGGGQAAGQNSQYTMPIPGYTGPLTPHHAGNATGAVDLFAPPGTPIVAAAGGTVVRAGPYGAAGNDIYIQGDDGRVYDYEHTDGLQVKPGDVVKAGQPLGVVATLENGGSSVGPATHLHFAVGTKDGGINYDDHGTGDADALGMLKGIQAGNLGSLNGLLPGPKPEIHAIGSQLVQYDPATGKASVIFDGTDLKAPTTHQIGNVLYQWDPNTRQWTQAITGPKTAAEIQAEQAQQGKVATLIQQAQSTTQYIKQQLASGQLTPQQADQYMNYLNDYTAAGLQGTTPWQRYQQQAQLDEQNTATAKDLLDTKVQQTTSLATSLLGDSMKSVTASKYGTMAPGTLSGVFQGALDQANQQTAPLSNLAQQLLATVSQHAQAAGLDPRVPGTPPPGMPSLPVGPDQAPLPAPAPQMAA